MCLSEGDKSFVLTPCCIRLRYNDDDLADNDDDDHDDDICNHAEDMIEPHELSLYYMWFGYASHSQLVFLVFEKIKFSKSDHMQACN